MMSSIRNARRVIVVRHYVREIVSFSRRLKDMSRNQSEKSCSVFHRFTKQEKK